MLEVVGQVGVVAKDGIELLVSSVAWVADVARLVLSTLGLTIDPWLHDILASVASRDDGRCLLGPSYLG